jgi:hypothetical protein
MPPSQTSFSSRITNSISPTAKSSNYRTVLPTEAELIAELERERRVIEQNQNGCDP